MSETLEQIAARVAYETDAEQIKSPVHPSNSRDLWNIAYARRLVAALGAQEPVAVIEGYFTQSDYATVVVAPSVVNGQKLYAAPVVKEGWQMVPKEPTPEMVKASWDMAGYVRVPSGRTEYISIAYQAMLAAAPEYEK